MIVENRGGESRAVYTKCKKTSDLVEDGFPKIQRPNEMEKLQNWFRNAPKQAGQLDSFSCLELQLLWVSCLAVVAHVARAPGSPISMSQGRWLPTGESGRGIFLAWGWGLLASS